MKLQVKVPIALTIAGSDSGGGAGIQADIKTFTIHKVYSASVITAITAQNTRHISEIEQVSNKVIWAQLKAIFEDFNVAYVKIGMLLNLSVCKIVYDFLKTQENIKIIFDPVMVSKHQNILLKNNTIAFLKKDFFKLTYLITPNIAEAEALSGKKIHNLADVEEAAKIIYEECHCENILIKGGHLPNSEEAIDTLYDGKAFHQIRGLKFHDDFTHGTGCSLSSAITANLYNGHKILDAIKMAKKFVASGIKKGVKVGSGINPINHFHTLDDFKED